MLAGIKEKPIDFSNSLINNPQNKSVMNIGILAVDSNYPNLALMKISSYHKARGDNVEWYNPLCFYDKP